MTTRLPGLTSLRFFAAFWVVLYHLWRWDSWSAPALVLDVIAAAPVAVTFFFVLSGFLLTVTSVDAAGSLVRTRSSFWRARAARILPLHWLALLISAPVALALMRRAGEEDAFFVDGAAAFALVQAWIPGKALAWNPPAWSIAVEAVFYVLFPFVAPRLVKLDDKEAARTAITLWITSVLPCVIYVLAWPDGSDVVDHRTHAPFIELLKYHPLLRLPELLLGVLAGRLYLRGTRLPVGAGAAAGVVVFACSFVVPWVVLHNGLLAPLFGVVILTVASSPSTLSAPILVKLGDASYALYLLHVPLLLWIAGIAEKRTGTKMINEPAFAAAAVVVVVVASVAAFSFFEDPLRRKLRGP